MGIDQLLHIFKFSMGTRKLIYTTNAIESVNSAYKKLNRQRSVFPNPTSLLKSLYLSTMQVTKKWTQTIRNWGSVYSEFCIMYEGRMLNNYSYNSIARLLKSLAILTFLEV